MTRQTSATVLPWANSCSAVLRLRMICSAVGLVRFLVECPAQFGRLRTLIHPGPISGAHVRQIGSRSHAQARPEPAQAQRCGQGLARFA